MEEAEFVVAIDAVRGGGTPGDLYRVPLAELLPEGEREAENASLHGGGLVELLRHAAASGWAPRGFLLGLEPEEVAEWSLQLSPPVAAQLDRLIEEVAVQLRARGLAVELAEGSW